MPKLFCFLCSILIEKYKYGELSFVNCSYSLKLAAYINRQLFLIRNFILTTPIMLLNLNQ